MYFRIDKNNKFAGFYEAKEEQGTFVDINIEDWQNVLNKQSQGEIIFYNAKTKKLETILLGKFETFENGGIVFQKEEKIETLKKELSALKVEYSEKEFLFQGKYWQKNREKGDRANLS